MATQPHEVSPGDPPPGPELLPTAAQKRRGWRYGSSWILLLLILAVWYVGFGWGDSGGWLWGHRGAPAPAASEPSGAGLVILEVANKQDYIGQNFHMGDVAVDRWSNGRAVWIGSRHSYLPMLLILAADSSLAASASAAGSAVQHLDVTGTIVKAPPAAQAQQEWRLSDDEVDQLEQEGVYIQATRVQAAH